MEQPSYYAILTANVRYDNNLTDSEKILFAEITALSNKYGYCTASNSYFAKLYEVHKVTISKRIGNLKECGYVAIELVRDGGEIKQRKLYPLTQTLTGISDTTNRGVSDTTNRGISANAKDNNTSNNNTSNNNTSINNHHHYIDNNYIYSNTDEVNTNTLKGGGGNNPFTFFQQNGFGIINGYIAQDIDEWRSDFKEYGDEMLILAMKIAIDNKKNTWSYAKSILKRWLNERIITPEDVKADEKSNETKKKYKDPDKMTHEERKIAMQDPAYWD